MIPKYETKETELHSHIQKDFPHSPVARTFPFDPCAGVEIAHASSALRFALCIQPLSAVGNRVSRKKRNRRGHSTVSFSKLRRVRKMEDYRVLRGSRVSSSGRVSRISRAARVPAWRQRTEVQRITYVCAGCSVYVYASKLWCVYQKNLVEPI
jgi:hypothetical protein